MSQLAIYFEGRLDTALNNEFIADPYIATEADYRLGDRLQWLNKRSALGVYVG